MKNPFETIYFNKSYRIKNKRCENSKISYFFESEKNSLSLCSIGCSSCSSFSKCLECIDSYYLTFSLSSATVCESCAIPNNCKTCVMYSNILQNKLTIVDLNVLASYSELEKSDYEPLCLNCLPNFVRKEDNKCYFCDLIGCDSCSYGNAANFNISADYDFLIIDSNLQNLQFLCLDCGSYALASLDSKMKKCESCSVLIPNCENCFYFWPNKTKKEVFSDILIKCQTCITGYGLADANGTKCLLCPENCEYCYFYSTNANLICGRCKSNFILNYDSGECIAMASVSEIPEDYKKDCFRIINKNPLKNNILGSINFLCQLCSDSEKAPSISGNCVTKSRSCVIPFEYTKDNVGILNITDTLYYQPHYLENFIKNSNSLLNYFSGCILCKLDIFAFSSESYECCDANASPKIEKCLSCSSCLTINGSLSCETCKECVSSGPIINLSISPNDFSYVKTIFVRLLSIINIFPIMNNGSYASLFSQLSSFQYVELDSINLNGCYPCPIMTSKCERPTDFSADPYESDYAFDAQNDGLKLLHYRLIPLECKPGFIYDSVLKRCLFCPDGWEFCQSYKEIKINFIKSSQIRNKETEVQSFKDLIYLVENTESDLEFNFICNEFAIQNLTYIVTFQSELEFIENDLVFSFTTTIAKRVPSLKNVNIVFQPEDYSTSDPLIKVKLYMVKRLIFQNFNNVILKNFDFKIVPFILPNTFTLNIDTFLNTIPGFSFKNQNFEFFDCSFSNYFDSDIYLFEGKLYENNIGKTINSVYKDQPLFLFIIYTQNNDKNVINFEKIELRFNFEIPLIKNLKIKDFLSSLAIFYFLSESVTIIDLKMTGMSFSDFQLFSIGSQGKYEINVKNTILSNCELERVSIFSGKKSNLLNLDTLLIKNSNLNRTIFFQIEKSSNAALLNVLLENNSFNSDEISVCQLFIFSFFTIKTFNVVNNNINSYTLIVTDSSSAETDTYSFSLIDFFLLDNIYNTKIQNQLFFSILFPSLSLISTELYLKNGIILKILMFNKNSQKKTQK